jgi:type IV secretion system protein VirB9
MTIGRCASASKWDRYINGYYVVDRLIDVAELRIGEKPQTIVRITRTGDRG